MRIDLRSNATAACLLALTLAGCGGGRDVTPDSLSAARKLWDDARIRDYDLEWASSGAQAGHYRVYVRGGIVRAVRQVVRDPRDGSERVIEAKPGNMSYYGIDGLFTILDEERLQLQDDQPFGRPKGTAAVLKFAPDPKLGYPTRYRRDVAGSPKGLAIDVIGFLPNPPAAIPPPSP